MMNKQKPEQFIQNHVARTLLIPLYMRSQESKRKKSILRDPVAVELVNKIDFDFSLFKSGIKMTQTGTAIRVKHFDDKVAQFIARHKEPVVVIVGCGLDTRYERLGCPPSAVFYQLDLPEVIAWRKSMLAETNNNIFKPASLLETAWMDELQARHPQGRFIFVFEGVLMYFEEAQVRNVLTGLATRFHLSEVLFDVVSPMQCKDSLQHPAVKALGARFVWGAGNAKEIEAWSANIKYVDITYYMNQHRLRWGLLGNLIGLLPAIAKGARILHFRFL